ncbi:MAG: hypothetical protein IIA45_12480 [Bacteroidetes bacterium]|nr:hypothetical protein [Bacteroidota bacterium]
MRLTMGKTEFLVDGNASEIPPNGSGSYEIIGDKILFIDSTLRALDSYSDFMLFGEYEFKFNGRKLKIWKEGDYD